MSAPIGYRDDTTDNSEFNVMSFIIKQMLSAMWAGTVVQVVAVYPAAAPQAIGSVGYVDVMPLVNMIDSTGVITKHSTIFRLPYSRVQAGLNAVVLDPVVNDIGWAVFADRDISSVINSGAQASPGSRRMHDPADGVYLFGIGNMSSPAPTQYIQFLAAGGGINMKSPSNININGAVITPAGEVIAKYGTGNSVTLTGHEHTQGNDSHGDTEVNTNHPIYGT